MSLSTLHVETPGRGFVDITARVQQAVRDSGSRNGICNVFIHHTSASLMINENADPNVQRDFLAWFERLVTDGDPIFAHVEEGPDDMSAHIRSALTATCLTIPVVDGQCLLGTWQGIFVFEHRQRPYTRRVSVKVVGG